MIFCYILPSELSAQLQLHIWLVGNSLGLPRSIRLLSHPEKEMLSYMSQSLHEFSEDFSVGGAQI